MGKLGSTLTARKLPFTIPKNSREQIRLNIGEFNSYDYADLRLWYLGDDGDWKPGRGLTVPPSRWRRFRQAVEQLGEELEARGLLPDQAEEDGEEADA